MTNEERQTLCEALRRTSLRARWFIIDWTMKQAADEIERLAAKDTTLQALIGVLTYENKRAANEIERLASELQITDAALERCGFELDRHVASIKLRSNR